MWVWKLVVGREYLSVEPLGLRGPIGDGSGPVKSSQGMDAEFVICSEAPRSSKFVACSLIDRLYMGRRVPWPFLFNLGEVGTDVLEGRRSLLSALEAVN